LVQNSTNIENVELHLIDNRNVEPMVQKPWPSGCSPTSLSWLRATAAAPKRVASTAALADARGTWCSSLEPAHKGWWKSHGIRILMGFYGILVGFNGILWDFSGI